MPIHTTIIDFHLDPPLLIEPAQCAVLRQSLEKIMKEYGYTKEWDKNSCDGFIEVYTDSGKSYASVRGYQKGIVTLTIEEWLEEADAFLPSPQKATELEKSMLTVIKTKKTVRLPPIKRGNTIDIYCTTSDNRLMEYDFDRIVLEKNSPFQNIKIYHSQQFGNMLYLDDLQNIADSDLIYTRTLMRHDIEDYGGKTILILGGGDGGLLHELRKEKPKHITMIEIDEMVIDVCREHLRHVCGDSLDSLKGPDYEIVVDDCVEVMQMFIKQQKAFDYVIGDLTDIPITASPQGEVWDFIRKILDLSFLVLAPNGKFFTHGNGSNSIAALAMFEKQLSHLSTPVTFKRHTAFIPSFMEVWAFYEAWKSNGTLNSKKEQ